MKKEPGFWREDFIKDALEKLHKKLRKKYAKISLNIIEKEFDEVGVL